MYCEFLSFNVFIRNLGILKTANIVFRDKIMGRTKVKLMVLFCGHFTYRDFFVVVFNELVIPENYSSVLHSTEYLKFVFFRE